MPVIGGTSKGPPLPRRLRRLERTRNAFWCVLIGCTVLSISTESLIPDTWKGGKGAAGGTGPSAMVRNRQSGALEDLSSDVTAWADSWMGLSVGTRVRVVLFETAIPPSDPRDPNATIPFDQALADIRDACERRCEAVGDRPAAALFDRAFAAGTIPMRNGTVTTGGEAGVTYPWRYPVALLRIVFGAGMVLGMTAGLAIPLALEALIWRQRKRVLTCCGECGYDLAGLGATTACPECGNVPIASQADPKSPAATA